MKEIHSVSQYDLSIQSVSQYEYLQYDLLSVTCVNMIQWAIYFTMEISNVFG